MLAIKNLLYGFWKCDEKQMTNILKKAWTFYIALLWRLLFWWRNFTSSAHVARWRSEHRMHLHISAGDNTAAGFTHNIGIKSPYADFGHIFILLVKPP